MPILDGLVALLLVVCIVYCIKLNKKILALHKNKNDFAKGLKYFDDAILRAETSITELKNVSNKVVVLQETISKANHVLNDLSFMADRAANLTDKLEMNIKDARMLLSSPAMHVLTKDERYEGLGNSVKLGHQPESEASRAMALESLLERISAAKDSQKKKVANHFEHIPPQRQTSQPQRQAGPGSSFLKTLRTLNREDPV